MHQIHRLALSALRASSWAIIPTDKDGGFTLLDRNNLAVITAEICRNGNYILHNQSTDELTDISQKYSNICKRISKIYDDPQVWQALVSDLHVMNTTSV